MIGIHVGWRDEEGQRYNWGISVAAIFDTLKTSHPTLWEEIRSYHNLQTEADVDKERLLREKERAAEEHARRAYEQAASVLFWFDPTALQPYPPISYKRTARSLLLDEVITSIDPSGVPKWALKTETRRKALENLGSLEQMKNARAATHVEPSEGQTLIDTLLSTGDLPNWRDLPTRTLSEFRSVCDWFLPFIPSLPKPTEVDALLALRRLLEPFDALGGKHFRNRRVELEALKSHLTSGPDDPVALTIDGAGGSGKSALLARFILNQTAPNAAPPILLAYLDYDRALLDARKPAGLYAEIKRQVELQATDLPPAVEAAAPESPASLSSELEMRRHAKTVAARIHAAMKSIGAGVFLLAFDSFEEVQFATSENSGASVAWLDALFAECPEMRVVILGRVPIANLTVGGKKALALTVGPLDPAASREVLESFLGDAALSKSAAATALVTAAGGNPLTLRVGAELIKRLGEEKAGEALRDLPSALVRGVLYDRVLERIHDARVRTLARFGLVLRRITPEILRTVLAPIAEVDLPTPQSVDDTFAALRREVFLAVSDVPGVLAHRPELRTLTVRLIEHDAPEKVRRLDAEAMEYYQKRAAALPPDDDAAIQARAEALYHALRLDLPAAQLENLWAPIVLRALDLTPDDQLPEGALRWLKSKVQGNVERVGPTHSNPAAEERNALWGKFADLFGRSVVFTSLPVEVRAELREQAERARETATRHGNAPELVRASLLVAHAAELEQRWPEAEVYTRLAANVEAAIGPVFAAALGAHAEKIAQSPNDNLPVNQVENRHSVSRVLEMEDPALRLDVTLGRYAHAMWHRVHPAVLSKGIERLGLGITGDAELDKWAELLSASGAEPDMVEKFGRGFGIRPIRDGRSPWRNIVRSAVSREDGAMTFARLVQKEPRIGDAVAQMWIGAGRSVFHPHLADALSRTIARCDDKFYSIFTFHQLAVLRPAFEQLTSTYPDLPNDLTKLLPPMFGKSKSQMPSPGTQLLSDLREVSMRPAPMFSRWLHALLERMPPSPAKDILTKALQIVGSGEP
ncbi:MAG: hypothetical protein IPK82_42985 [Polyangiaceae bacterium]|nr:hypothetical protein [Polyangiaceae bacterium]